MKASKDVQEKIVHFVALCTNNNNTLLFDDLITKLNENELREGDGHILKKLDFPFDLEYLIYEVLKIAHEHNWNSQDLINMLQISYQSIVYQERIQPRISPVWSGPTYDEDLIQFQTYNAVKHLFNTANREVFIVGYNFSFRNEMIRNLFKELEKAADRNCRINIVVNDEDENYNELRNNWGKEQYLLNIYSWKGADKNSFTSLHAKLLIIDQQKLFLTSANFSYHGFMKNIETGVIIENHPVIRIIWKQYQILLKNNEIRKVH